jgi:LPS export ABC transporter protein LptC
MILLVAVTALAVVVVRYFVSSSHRESRPAIRPLAVDVALKSIHFTEDDGTTRKWELFAVNGEYDKAADRTSLKDIRFVVERSGKAGPITVTARHGEYAHASKNVNLQGDVLARTEDGTSITTPKILYNSSSRVLSGKERIRLADAALVVEGTGFDLDIDSRVTRVHSNVTATIYPGKRKR